MTVCCKFNEMKPSHLDYVYGKHNNRIGNGRFNITKYYVKPK